MIPIEKFTLQEHEGQYKDRPLKSSLYFCGEDTRLKVSGYVIEKQFELPSYFLLLINWDCPFEEGYEVVVLNKQIKIIGSYSFTSFYNSYLLSNIREKSKDCYELVFNESDHFEISINYPKQSFLSSVINVYKSC